jgi:CheY-like chemotaxis protein
VSLYLPRAIGVELAGTPRAVATAELPRGSAAILVVEDDDDVRAVAVTILRDLGYQVLTAADGAEALRLFDAHAASVELLLIDVMLPGGLKGDEVAHQLRAKRPGLRTLFMTGYTDNPVVHRDHPDDNVQLIGKPFQRAQLAHKVAEMLRAASTQAPGVIAAKAGTHA